MNEEPIESREIPDTLRKWAAEIREWGINALLSPASYEEAFEDMAGRIERDCNRLARHQRNEQWERGR